MNIHDKADALSRSRGITLTEAYRELSRRARAARRRNYGRTIITAADRTAFAEVRPVRYWWSD